MPKSVVEGRLKFDFPVPWLVLKFDDTLWYREIMKSRMKAVDVVACAGKSHWWVEVKDCLSFEAENLLRLLPSDPPEVAVVRDWAKAQGHRDAVLIKRAKPFIVDEVAEKLEGTLLSLAVARRASATHTQAEELLPMAAVLDDGAQLSVVLPLTWDPEARDFGRLAMRLNDKLRQRLAAYQLECFVVNEGIPIPGQPWQLTRNV